MNIRLCACVIAGLTLAAAPALAEEITNKEQFLEMIAGKKLVEKNAWVVIARNGTVHGRGPKNGDIVGEWKWKGRYYCRDIIIDNETLPHDCQVVTVNGNSVAFTHNEGKGISVVWTVE
ncbi:hypothetical protein [Nitratireductor sp. XY-223]|uniref:hypothetical protein n=1 Tax=Nitratireductor sp. XY-223 TaxID=2561926 RepID=UPI0010AAB7BA|nr:hypothetical protein [Nitratireductor sp. XY-223]